MRERLTEQSLFLSWQTGALFVLYFGIRLVSYLLAPHPVVQGILVFCIVLAFAVLYFRDPVLAWQTLLIELFLGGSGHYLELADLSLRTVLMITFVVLWGLHMLSNTALSHALHIDKRIALPLGLFAVYAVFAGINGINNGHGITPVLRDLTPFGFFVLLFPFQQLFHNHQARALVIRLFIVYLLGTAIFLTVLLFLYSQGILEIHEPFYKWFRDVNVGKITDMKNGFFRIVEPSHLLIVPVILFVSSLLMKPEKHHPMWRVLLVAALIILSINLSRMYLLALGVGWLVLLYKHHIHRWFTRGIITLVLLLTIFTGLSLVASNGATLGWELLGIRLVSVTNPAIETSSATRLALLPSIANQISSAPLFGVGPGATVSYIDPVSYTTKTTNQFDWGYFEMIAEFGAIGTFLYLWLIGTTIYLFVRHIQQLRNYHDFHVGLLAGLISILAINLTVPALFHVLGVIYLIFLIGIAVQHQNTFDEIVTTLYRIFNRKKNIV